jgi:ABC-type nitrate/sulfonate/bicarbonate transport system substrate-binding protein
MMRHVGSALAAIAIAIAMTCGAPLLAAPVPVRVSVVSQTATNWVLYAALANGDFARAGLAVTLEVAGSSPKLIAGLHGGTVDVASMAAGHVLDGVEAGRDMFIVMGLNRPIFSLVGAAKYNKVSDLRGAVIGVDQGRTGYVHLVRALLKDAGITADDYRINDVGGVEARYKALLAGEIDVALMTVPQDLLSVEHGYRIIAEIEHQPEAYTGSVAVARREWARANKDTLVAYIRGYRRSLDWLYDPANEAAAVKVLVANVPVDEAVAHRIYRETLLGKGWLLRDGRVHASGLAAVAAQMGLASAPDDPAWLPRFFDPSYFDAALAAQAGKR